MEYIITIIKNKYELWVDNGDLVINGRRHPVQPKMSDLNEWAKGEYMESCIKEYGKNFTRKEPFQDMYEEASLYLEESSKQKLIKKSYLMQMTDVYFPDIEDFVTNNTAADLLLGEVLIQLVINGKLPQPPYNVGMIFRKKDYNNVHFDGTTQTLCLPITGSDAMFFDPKLIYESKS